ncbi:TetR/AcrR family transcriptional regulator C-terminal domain-containing protein [Shewanella maritima]|uniref:TetR/AcrR family transcriptional regulator C-terminal domain-containing protein n=1 Tax=Shewanella maritima TaxID=2520507 RepID=UPI0037356C12
MTELQKKSRSELKREAIIEAAKATFKQDGVAATSMDKVAEVAQVSKRTVYNHFATKEALVMHLVSEMWLESLQKDNVTYDAEVSLEVQLTQLLCNEIRFMSQQDYIDLTRMAIGHLFYDCAQMEQELARFKKAETAIFRWITSAKADGKLVVQNVQYAAEQLQHLIKGQCFWMQIIASKPPLTMTEQQSLAKETAAMFLARYQLQTLS